MNAERTKSVASAWRDVLALLYTPIVTTIEVWLICILAYKTWGPDTDQQRINFLGIIAIVTVALVGLGGQWFQRNRLAGLKIDGPGGFHADIDTEADNGTAAPSVTTTTTTETVTGQNNG